MKHRDNQDMTCSFCGKSKDEVRRLIAGPGVYICDECIDLCADILEEELEIEEAEAEADEEEKFEAIKLAKPKEIVEHLDEYVIEQDRAKRVLAVAVYNHYKRINKKQLPEDIEIQKSNILMIGPTGSGKTLLAQTLAKTLNVPFAIADATTLTEAGYVGEDVENILLKLIQAADYNVKRAEKGIIYIDEIDKIARKSENPSITRDVSGEGVQQAILKILEGTDASVPPQGGRKHPSQDMIKIDTTDILFICGGAFNGLETIVQRRVGEKTIGFATDIEIAQEKKKEAILQAEPEDMIRYGVIPELMGRLPMMVALKELGKEALLKILVEPKNAIVKQYQALFQLDGVELEIEEEALDAIAEKTLKRKTGARGLRSIMEDLMINIMYDIPSREDIAKCIITRDVVEHEKEPKIILKPKSKKTLKGG